MRKSVKYGSSGCLIYLIRCQYCKRLVYFYSNTNGSRVFFNDLGGSWEKHDCCGQQDFISESELRKYQSAPARQLDEIRALEKHRAKSTDRFHVVMTASERINEMAVGGVEYTLVRFQRVGGADAYAYFNSDALFQYLNCPLAEVKLVSRFRRGKHYPFVEWVAPFLERGVFKDGLAPSEDDMRKPFTMRRKAN